MTNPALPMSHSWEDRVLRLETKGTFTLDGNTLLAYAAESPPAVTTGER